MTICKYRTRLCRYRDACKYGRNCHFAHSLEEMFHYQALQRRAMLIEQELVERDLRLKQLENRLRSFVHDFIEDCEEERQLFRDSVTQLHDETLPDLHE